ncbi:MAG: hypothetical protein IJF75_05550 [Clostridia bacterium]|nr:hypothetical protein [Clostridia bacterium]
MKKISVLLIAIFALFVACVPKAAKADENNFYIEYDTEKVAMLGGKEFTLDLFGATSEVEWQVHNGLLCDIVGDNQSVTVMPKSSGVAIISARCGDLVCYAEINIIDIANSQDAKIVVESFNRAGEAYSIGFSASGYEKFYNFQGEWRVTDSNGKAVPITLNGEKITVEKEYSFEGEYKVNLTSPGFSPFEETVTVSQLNVDEILNKVLPILAIAVMVILVLVILGKRLSSKLSAVYKSVNAYISNYEKVKVKINKGVNKLIFNDKVAKLSLSLKNVTSNVQMLNMDSFGYYQRLQDLLMKACSVLDAALVYKNYDETFSKDFFDKFEQIYLIPCKTLTEQLLAIEKKPVKQPLTDVEKINMDSQERKKQFGVKKYNCIEDVLNAGNSCEDDEDDD